MKGKLKIKLFYIPEGESDKYSSEQLIYEQTCNEDWLIKTNPDYFQKVIAAFNGVEWKINEH
jgi:hypothetical protein